uniref:DUF7880 domain-containing protein n=1 Tax=Rhizophora mucronata TaxID=61149 RepID=A0A2P2KAT7_RHIMU
MSGHSPSVMAAAHFSSRPFSTKTLTPQLSSNNSKKRFGVWCALCTPSRWRESRRLVSISLLLSPLLLLPDHAMAENFLDKYVKRKKLDPLEAYVPAVILTQLQIKDLASLRVNIRAVAQYASDAGNGNTAFSNVDQCLRALEELDSLLLHASRNDPEASIKTMKEKIGVALNALDSLLKTIPSDVLDKGKAVADAYRTPTEEEPEIADPKLRQLESIL